MANATLTISGSVGGAAIGAYKVNFDDLALGSGGGTANGPNGSVNVSFVTDGQSVVGAVAGQYAPPYLSGFNGTGFGSQPMGPDTTTYLTTGMGAGRAILTWTSGQKYLGLLWGSVDDYNTLELWNGTTYVGTVTGAEALASPSGNQGVNGTVYVNIYSDLAFDKVIASSTQYAFEFDNVAYSAVPEPTTMVAGALLLLPFGASTLRMLRKNRAA